VYRREEDPRQGGDREKLQEVFWIGREDRKESRFLERRKTLQGKKIRDSDKRGEIIQGDRTAERP